VLEIQRLERTSGGSRGRGTRTINALIHDPAAGEGTGQSKEAERARSVSPYSGSQGSGGSGNTMNFCTGCRCKHLEPGGPGVCPWRKTDTAGKPIIKYPQYNGWDPVYTLILFPDAHSQLHLLVYVLDLLVFLFKSFIWL
jgi:hypothetical protein